MEKKRIVATVLQFVAGALYVLTMAFIYLDAAVLKIGLPEMEGWEGLGIAVILALAIIFQFTTSGIAAIFHIVVGSSSISAARKGKMVHTALRVLLMVFGIIALLVNVYFIYCYLDLECVLWGIVNLMAALVSLAALIASSAFKAVKAVPAMENTENIEITE